MYPLTSSSAMSRMGLQLEAGELVNKARKARRGLQADIVALSGQVMAKGGKREM